MMEVQRHTPKEVTKKLLIAGGATVGRRKGHQSFTVIQKLGSKRGLRDTTRELMKKCRKS